MTTKKTALLHVVQASYGDCLILEYNETGTGDTKYMLIDGGPASTEPMYTTDIQSRVKFNLFYTLNRLSGSTLAAGTAPPANAMKKIDTLVLTHDDVDHKQGIETLFASLLKTSKISKHKDDLYNTWVLGDSMMKAKKRPVDNIWYNGLKAITTLRNGEPDITITDNWFDRQLAAYNGIISPVINFNTDFAASKDPTGRSGNFAMINATAASTGGLIKQGQFTIQFLGPSWDVLENDGLLGLLQGKNSLRMPKYKFDKQVLGKAATTALSSSTIDEFVRLGQDEELEIKLDSSMKNRSSIAFIATDGATRILLLGDAIAPILKPLYKPGGAPVDFTLMKVMHHGSSYNNYWTRDAQRKAEEKTVQVIQDNKFDIATLAYIYFFAKIRAKKYVISAALDVHPNPHVATMIGIIAAATENQTNVEIFLTNYLAPDVLHTIGERFIKKNVTAIPHVAINLLAQGSHSGTIGIYDGTTNGPEWVSYIARDLRTSYPDNLVKLNPKVASKIKVTKDFRFEPYVKKLKKAGPASTTTLAVASNRVLTPRAFHAFIAGAPVLATIPFIITAPAPILVVPRASPSPGIISTKLLGASTPPSHRELVSYQPYSTRSLSEFDGLLQYLVAQNEFTTQEMEDVKTEIVNEDGLKFGAFAALFMGVERSEAVLAAFPFDFLQSPDYLDSADGPAEWRLQNLTTRVVDPSDPDFSGRQGIYSLSFTIPARPDNLWWSLPFDEKAFAANAYKISWDGAMSVYVVWPNYVMGITSIEFRGHFVTATKSYNVVCQILLIYDQPATYSVRFADANFSTDNFKMSLTDLARVFGTNVQFGLAFEKLILPGIEHILNDLDVNVGLDNTGFTLHKVLSKLVVKNLFAEVKLTDIPAWNPFSSPFSLGLSALQIIVEDAYSSDNRKVLARLNGTAHTSGASDLNTPFQFTVQWNPQEFLLYELALLPGIQDSLSIGRVLDITGISSAFDLSTAFPGLSNLSNTISISHVVAGWVNSEVKPDNLRFTVSLDDWLIAENVFEVTRISIEVEAKNLTSDDGKVFALNGWGIVNIGQIDVEVFFAYNHSSDPGISDQIYFQVGTQQRAIPLGSIIIHLLGDGATILPDSLSSILQETVMDNFIVKAERVGGKWSVSKIQISLSIQGKIDVIEGIEIGEPNLIVSIDNPFDKATRGIYVGINAQVEIAEVMCQASFTIVSAQSNMISMVFDAGQQPLTTEVVLSQFLPGADFVSLPPSLSFLAGIGILRASLSLEINQGKFSMSEITIAASSTQSLELWAELSLQQVTLFVTHSKYRGNKVEFDAMLTLTKNLDFLTFTLAYDGPSSTPSSLLANPGAVVSAGTTPGAVWSAMATYDGNLSVLDALSQMSGLQLNEILNNCDLPVIHDVLDINITKLQVALTHSDSKSSFSFDADLDWLCFSHVRFALSKSSVWAYSFGFAIGSSNENLIENIPILGPIIHAQVALEHVSLVVYNYNLDAGALDPLLNIPMTSSGGEIALAIACRLQFKDVMKDLTQVVGVGSMDIVGVVSSSMISLSAAIGDEIILFNGSMTIRGSVVVQCKEENKRLPMLGVQGDAKLDFGSWISKDPIRVSLWLFVNTADAGLGFKFTLDKWHGVFGFDGLDFDDVVFAAIFPPQQFPAPSSFTIKGSISLKVNKAGITGSVNVHFVEQNLTSSYATGSIEGLTLNTLIEVFAQVPQTPDYLDAGFGPLKFAIVPKDTVDESGKPLKQRFMMEGSFKLPFIHFEAAMKIDVTPTKVTIDGYLSRIVVLHEKLFSILPSPEESPPPPANTGASIHVHINDETSPFFAQASGQLTFLGLKKDLNFEISQKGLEFLLAQDVWTNKGALSGSIDDTHLEVAAAYEFALDLIKPDFDVGVFHFETTRIIAFGAAFSLNIIWENIQWELQISGSFQLFTLKIEKSFKVGASLMDLEAIGKQVAQWIVGTLAEDFLSALKKILSSIKDIINVLKEAGLAMAEILKFLITELGVAFEEAARAIQEAFGVAWQVIVNLLKNLGYLAQEIVDGLKKVGIAIMDIATAIGNEFGEAVRDLCSTLLKEAGSITSEVVSFFRNVFKDPGQAIVDLLVSWGRGIINIFSSIVNVIAAPFKAVFNWIFGSRPKKSREQVQEELLLTLMVRMNELLDQPVDIQSEADLEIIMRRSAVQRFKQNFAYDFNGSTTKPPSSQDPQAITATENKLSYTDGQNSHMDEYRDRILGGLTFKPWMRDAARADLNQELQLLLGVVPSTFWQIAPLKRTYYPSDPNQNPVELNAIVLFVNGALSFDGHDVTNTQSYYVGVYFEAPPPAKLARKSLQLQAFNRVPDANPLPTDEASLTNALTSYAAKSFKNHFSFDYQQRPPDSPDASLFCKTFNALAYFEDGNMNDVEPYIKTRILSMAPLPDWVQERALSDMLTDYRPIVTGQQKGSWRNFAIDRTYDRPGESFDPVNCKAYIVYYYDTKTTDQGVQVSIAYVFFLGIYYESPNHMALVRKDLIKILCDNLAQHMDNPDSMATLPDKTRLTIFLDRYGRDQFFKKHRYELMDEATDPGDIRVPGTPLFTIAQTGEFENWDDTKIATWVDSIISANVFAKDPAIRRDLISSVKYKLTGAIGAENAWIDDTYDKVYAYDSEKIVRVAGMFIHSNGYLVTGNDAVKISFMHFSGVFYVEEDDQW